MKTTAILCSLAAAVGHRGALAAEVDAKAGDQLSMSAAAAVGRRGALAAEVDAKAGDQLSMSAEEFQRQAQSYVAPGFTHYMNHGTNPGADIGVPSPVFAEGTVVMYCMDKDGFATALGKAAPGDIDLGTYTVFGKSNKAHVIRELSLGIADATKGDPAVEPGEAGYIKVRDSESTLLDVHEHDELELFGGDRRYVKSVPDYCLCSESVNAACAGMPVAPLSVVLALYKKHTRAKDNTGPGGGKIAYIASLQEKFGNEHCGPCDAYKRVFHRRSNEWKLQGGPGEGPVIGGSATVRSVGGGSATATVAPPMTSASLTSNKVNSRGAGSLGGSTSAGASSPPVVPVEKTRLRQAEKKSAPALETPTIVAESATDYCDCARGKDGLAKYAFSVCSKAKSAEDCGQPGPLCKKGNCVWKTATAPEAPLPAGWKKETTPEGDVYYVSDAGVRQWDLPVA